jgi:hypothetical protein
MRRTLLLIVLAVLIVAPWPVPAQEVWFGIGDTRETGTAGSHGNNYAFTYLQGVGENLAWSIGYLNEGHVPSHKRDGVDFQGWTRMNILNRQLSLGVGAGPYVYWDTAMGATNKLIYGNDHGMGAIFSAAATWYTESRFLIQGTLNYVVTNNSINTLSTNIGLGYQLDKPTRPGPLTGASPAPEQTVKNELTFFGGRTVTTSGRNEAAVAESLQYRRNLTPHLN